MDDKESKIADDYKEFVKVAEEVTERDLALYPLSKHEEKRERYEHHLLDMVAMYESRYGSKENPYKSAWQALTSITRLGGTPEQERLIRNQMQSIEIEFKIGTFGALMKAGEDMMKPRDSKHA